MWGNPELRVLDPEDAGEFAAVETFLRQFSLRFDQTLDYTVVLYLDGRIVGTGSFAGKVIRNIAVLPQYQGEGLTAMLVSSLMQELSRRGVFHYLLFTKPERAAQFEALGFSEVARAEPYAVLLETGLYSISQYCREVAAVAAVLPAGRRAAVVVNCNPFTLGHRALIERAAVENDAVIVFVVSEDRSLFPFAVRLQLVQAGVSDLNNVVVVSGGDYSVSQATFPTYFSRESDALPAQTRLDASVFASRIAPAVGIGLRYVGEEPYCQVTGCYNQSLADILPRYGIDLRVIERRSLDGDYISASKVREMIRCDDWAAIARVVPASTYAYLRSEAAKPVIARIKATQSRH
ncbi:MAG: [citrate (pro-3S)-lyase] ligase [Sporomusaceae bacterium]|nr:[citrate (pro-3S)-lyase] ligase [Sporomusaceae bacterium]